MFRLELQECDNTTVLKIYGRLVQEYIEAARSLVARSQPKSRIVADLSETTHVDEAGEQFLEWLKYLGVQFVPGDAYSRGVCDRLQLPRSEDAPSRKQYARSVHVPSHGKTRHRKVKQQ